MYGYANVSYKQNSGHLEVLTGPFSRNNSCCLLLHMVVKNGALKIAKLLTI